MTDAAYIEVFAISARDLRRRRRAAYGAFASLIVPVWALSWLAPEERPWVTGDPFLWAVIATPLLTLVLLAVYKIRVAWRRLPADGAGAELRIVDTGLHWSDGTEDLHLPWARIGEVHRLRDPGGATVGVYLPEASGQQSSARLFVMAKTVARHATRAARIDHGVALPLHGFHLAEHRSLLGALRRRVDRFQSDRALTVS
ncbi:hypothetical protein [Jannaschia ovalis]|uniref:PH domain-containing protein n=1 Tax=Jannaschia ovalis TaxID=3038773 RepID=A0ABY8LGA0_9RHOB|nr:hypothetical protein [Jannaschia sp. GRR-S6-38]WGH79228.1 hypothetical protein P8627_02895 [Jannaschia sp. GRR-S6-38]